MLTEPAAEGVDIAVVNDVTVLVGVGVRGSVAAVGTSSGPTLRTEELLVVRGLTPWLLVAAEALTAVAAL